MVVVDTGPLLCFGAVTNGPRLLIGRYKGRLGWVAAVADEIKRRAGGREQSRIARLQRTAAAKWMGPPANYLGSPHVLSDRVAVDGMRSRVQGASRRPTVAGHDLGESETLVLAGSHNALALINEDAARTVARAMRLQVHCALDVLIGIYQDGKIELRQVQAMYEQLREADLDPGEVLPSPCKARNLAGWKTPAPS
jgi:hypothetical protein